MTQNGNKGRQPNNGGPPCPKIERLEEIIDIVSYLKQTPDQTLTTASGKESVNDVLDEVALALDWLHTMLSNRKTYQKKQQITKKVTFEIARQMLGEDELAAIKVEANRRLAEEVSK